MSIVRIGPDGRPAMNGWGRNKFMDRVFLDRKEGKLPTENQKDQLLVFLADDEVSSDDKKRAMELLAPLNQITSEELKMFTGSPSLSFYAAYVHPHWKSSLFFGAIFLIILLIF